LPTVPCLVLDPFAGTATVGKVCAQHGRSFVGTELNLKYIALADERTSSVQVTMPL
jgi:DNA modification methylase